ncbi:hypothetical protein SFA19_14530, partial [Legionella pneumophila]|nr:hypothetical protein [Legionella pneumophila]
PDFSLPSLKIERSVYTLNPFQKITILIRFQSISRAFDNFHSLARERIINPIFILKISVAKLPIMAYALLQALV